jgi:hypothetical protein
VGIIDDYFRAFRSTRWPVLGGIMGGILGLVVTSVGWVVLMVLLVAIFPSIDVLHVDVLLSIDALQLWYSAAVLGYPVGVSLGVRYIAKRRRQEGSFWRAILGAFLGAGLAMGFLRCGDLATRIGFDLPEWITAVVVLGIFFLIPLLATLGFNPALRWASGLDELYPREVEWLQECVLGQDQDKSDEQMRKALEEYLRRNPPHIIRYWGMDVYECPRCSVLNERNSPRCRICMALVTEENIVPNPYLVPYGWTRASADLELDLAPQHLPCLECHTPNPPGSTYCGECGAELGSAGTTLPDGTVHE